MSRAPWIYPTGRFIRDWLLEHKEGYAYEIWRDLKEKRKEMGLHYPTYRSFWNYIRILRELGLIRVVRVERPLPQARWHRRYLSIVPGREDDPAWDAPQKAYNPLTGLGRKYKRLKEEAAKMGVPPGEALIRKHPEKVRETAKRFGITEGEVRRRLRKRR